MKKKPEIPGYRIERELGQGGSSWVYLAFEEKLERYVALKVLLPSLAERIDKMERFIKEAKTAAKLIHPNIITIHDVGEFEGCYFLTMEYLEGGSVNDNIKEKTLSEEKALETLKCIADALDYARSKGIIHRDIKPGNIMFRRDGTPVLLDFGIAKMMGSTTNITETGASWGTPYYMSPEQIRGEKLDGRTDIYSMGILLYEMLTYQIPFNGEDAITIAFKHIMEPIPTLPEKQKKYQPIVNAMMAKSPQDRIQTGAKLKELINRILSAGTHVTATQIQEKQPSNRKIETLAKKKQDAKTEKIAFNFAKNIGNPEAFKLYLERYPWGVHSEEAKKRLNQLEEIQSPPQKVESREIDKINISHIPKIKFSQKDKPGEFSPENLKKASRSLFMGGGIWYIMVIILYLKGAEPNPLDFSIELIFGILFFVLGTILNKIHFKYENETPKKSYLTLTHTMLWFIISIATFHTLKHAYLLLFKPSQIFLDLVILILSVGMTGLSLMALLVLKIKPEKPKIEKRDRPLY